MQANGKKQITEAVVIAVLSLAATELFHWGVNEFKRRAKPVKTKKKRKQQS